MNAPYRSAHNRAALTPPVRHVRVLPCRGYESFITMPVRMITRFLLLLCATLVLHLGVSFAGEPSGALLEAPPRSSLPLPITRRSRRTDRCAPALERVHRAFKESFQVLHGKPCKPLKHDMAIRCRGMSGAAVFRIANASFRAAAIGSTTCIRRCRGKIVGPSGS